MKKYINNRLSYYSSNMRLLKTHPILGLLNSYVVDSPQPSSISYMWNFGSLLGTCLIIQIITGITLAMHYTPSIDLAFVSVEHIHFFDLVHTGHYTMGSLILSLNKGTRSIPITKKELNSFYIWFSGFVDGEGSFGLSVYKNHWRWFFRIRLHIDELPTLQYIQQIVGVGRIDITSTDCVLVVDNMHDVLTIIIPLFYQYPLLTTKYLDFLDWAEAASISVKARTRKLSGPDLVAVHKLKAGMNTGRIHTSLPIPLLIDIQWILGFIEAEGTFGMKNFVPYFQVAQHVNNQHVLNGIAKYITLFVPMSLFGITIPKGLLSPSISSVINKKTNVVTYTVNGIDVLFFFILPLFNSLQFITRKSVDFHLWCLVVLIHKLGFATTISGRQVLFNIAVYINSNRYSTNLKGPIAEPKYNSIYTLIDNKSVFDLSKGLSHEENVRIETIAKGGHKGYLVYAYENGKLISGSPFNSYAKVQELIGLKPSSRIVSRYIDSGKQYRNIYSFFSSDLSKKDRLILPNF